ncbi:MAG: hypothetical protein WBW48_13755, partial [Anaerolineae bacterium]
ARGGEGESHCRDEKPEVPENEEVETRMEYEEEMPETPVSMVKLSQKKNIKGHPAQFLSETARTFLPPICQFINGTPPVEFPSEVQGSTGILRHSHHRSDDAE